MTKTIEIIVFNELTVYGVICVIPFRTEPAHDNKNHNCFQKIEKNKNNKIANVKLLFCLGYDKMKPESNFGLPKRISQGNGSLRVAENRKLAGLREEIRLKSRKLIAE